MGKYLPIAIAKHVRRYKRLCLDICYQYRGNVRYICEAYCIRLVKRCDPRLGESYAWCVEQAKQVVSDYIESRIRPRIPE